MSGDVLGRIFLWWTAVGPSEDPYVLYKIVAHSGPVKTMQFDAIYIVSGGADGAVCITDIATGEVMQTIRAHMGLSIDGEEAGEGNANEDGEGSGSLEGKDRGKLQRELRDSPKKLRNELIKGVGGSGGEETGEGDEMEEKGEGEDGNDEKVKMMVKAKLKARKTTEKKKVLAVAFDSNRLISVGTDNTLRYVM